MRGHVEAIAFLVPVCAAAVTFGLIALAQPLLRSYALARPNLAHPIRIQPRKGAESLSWRSPWLPSSPSPTCSLLRSVRKQLGLAAGRHFGAGRSRRGRRSVVLGAVPRLISQIVIVGAVVATLPDKLRVIPALPWWSERLLTLVAGLWFVNLVNFMDGIDWITVAEVVPITAALGLFGPSARCRLTELRGACALRRDDRLRTIQPAGGAAVSR